MEQLSGVDNTLSDAQVDLSPHQHLSPFHTLSPSTKATKQSVGILCVHTHRQTNRVFVFCVYHRPSFYSSSLILTGHLDFGAPLQQGSHPVPHDAAVESSMGAIQRRDQVPLMRHTQDTV